MSLPPFVPFVDVESELSFDFLDGVFCLHGRVVLQTCSESDLIQNYSHIDSLSDMVQIWIRILKDNLSEGLGGSANVNAKF